jgi:NAD-dependent dihydropyrimidine dehydrogenase PreA subunit
MTVISISMACTGCGACIATCPERALRPAARRPALVSRRCTLCLACIEVCPAGAIDVVPPGTGTATAT